MKKEIKNTKCILKLEYLPLSPLGFNPVLVKLWVGGKRIKNTNLNVIITNYDNLNIYKKDV